MYRLERFQLEWSIFGQTWSRLINQNIVLNEESSYNTIFWWTTRISGAGTETKILKIEKFFILNMTRHLIHQSFASMIAPVKFVQEKEFPIFLQIRETCED